MPLVLYGIRNCDSVKKARAWLEARGIDYVFNDYKKTGVDAARLAEWAARADWETLLNRRGTTWRKLPDPDRADMDQSKALALMATHPSLIKRPVVEAGDALLVGFDADVYAAALLR